MGTNSDNYPKAALKHLEDARVLMQNTRFDGAAYLAGYVVECALKTVIEVETSNVPQVHDLNNLQQTVNMLAVQAGARTGLLSIAAMKSLSRILPWRPEMRYREPQVTKNDAETWLLEAEAIYRQIIGGLTLAGVI